jgi:hypothetical protein
MEIRSYRAVFDLERRIYRVDRLRLNPAGVPVRGVVYFLALLAAVLLAECLPLARVLLGVLPWYVVDLAAPACAAALLTIVRIEGRSFHLMALALLRYHLARRQLTAWRPCHAGDTSTTAKSPSTRTLWAPPDIVVLTDGSRRPIRDHRYTGPGAVLVTVPHELREYRFAKLRKLAHRPQLRLREIEGDQPINGQVIALGPAIGLRAG